MNKRRGDWHGFSPLLPGSLEWGYSEVNVVKLV
jgi:hypothetical protein